MDIKATHKAALWGAVGGAAALGMIGSSWDFWVSHGAAERMAQQRASLAVSNALAPFCVEKFRVQKNVDARLAELKAFDQYAQVTYIEKGGWATLGGKTTPDSGVAKACAEALTKS